MSAVPTKRVAEVFVEVADTLVEDFDLVEFLQMVTHRTAELVDAAAAGLLLTDARGSLQFMAASDETAAMLELFQVQNSQGPCQDAFTTGTAVVNEDLARAGGRWPVFAPRATSAGYRSVHAIPLRLRRTTIGALGMFSTERGRLETEDVGIVQALADVATIGLLQERTIRRGEVLAEQLQGALTSRVVIEQAKGVLAQLHGTSIDDSFVQLRAYSRRTGQRLGDVARAVVEDPTAVAELTTG